MIPIADTDKLYFKKGIVEEYSKQDKWQYDKKVDLWIKHLKIINEKNLLNFFFIIFNKLTY